MSVFSNLSERLEHAGASAQQHDPLSLYERHSIGQEFSRVDLPKGRTREMELRSQEVFKSAWRLSSENKTDAPLPGASNFRTTRKFETRRVYSDSVVTWSVFLGLTALCGVIYGVILNYLVL